MGEITQKKVFGKKHGDKVFDMVNLLIMIVLLAVFLWPIWFVVIASVSDPVQVSAGNVLFIPKGFTLQAYEKVIEYKAIWTGYKNTIIYTICGTLLNMVITVCAAYPIARKDFMIKGFLTKAMLVTMYFNGGMIPTYLVVRNLHLTDSMWAIILPGACSVTNVLIARTYFANSIPESLQEAADLDGASIWQYLIKVVLPLSKPVLAVLTLYYAVGHWNGFYNALIYINDADKMPLQLFLRELLMDSKMALDSAGAMLEDGSSQAKAELAAQLQYSSIIVSSIPVICMYPFVQKHFVKGVMIGSVKG